MALCLTEPASMLEDELTCPVCLDLFRDPHQLPCGHNYCLPCLWNLQRSSRRGNLRGSAASSSVASSDPLPRGPFSCPECRHHTQYGTVFIQRNFKLASIANRYRQGRQQQQQQQQQQHWGASQQGALVSVSDHLGECSAVGRSARARVRCDFCPPAPGAGAEAGDSEHEASSSSLSRGVYVSSSSSSSSSHSPPCNGDSIPSSSSCSSSTSGLAVRTCLKCEVSMCAEHLWPHLKLPAFQGHLLVEPHADSRSRRCQEHGEAFRYFCLEDQLCLCGSCVVVGRHNDHSIMTLRGAARDMRLSVQKGIQTVNRRIREVEKTLRGYNEQGRERRAFLEAVDVQVSELGSALNGQVDRLLSALRECVRSFGSSDGAASDGTHLDRGEVHAQLLRDEAQLLDIRQNLLSLVNESDPFAFLKEYQSTGKRMQELLRRPLYSLELGVDKLALISSMDIHMVGFLTDLQQHSRRLIDTIYAMRYGEQLGNGHGGGEEEEPEEEEPEEEEPEEEEPEEFEGETGDEEGEGHVPEEEMDNGDHTGSSDELYVPEEEDEEEEEEEEGDNMDQMGSAAELYVPEEEEEEEEEVGNGHQVGSSDELYVLEEEDEEEEEEEEGDNLDQVVSASEIYMPDDDDEGGAFSFNFRVLF